MPPAPHMTVTHGCHYRLPVTEQEVSQPDGASVQGAHSIRIPSS